MPFEVGTGDRFDDRHGDANRGRVLHSLEHVFVEPCIAGGYFELSFARNAIDGRGEAVSCLPLSGPPCGSTGTVAAGGLGA